MKMEEDGITFLILTLRGCDILKQIWIPRKHTQEWSMNMYKKIIKNDIHKSKLITITITGFILVAAMQLLNVGIKFLSGYAL
jgi:hypothetical protein